ncbi:AAA family ATPase [Agrobacterium rosae]|uniref:AAA family ATPase n=1 Tax=Agrobacterium rosae TaxID=1972867 RepID=UPI0019D35142|nr:AAA family ATPase [Agrobacterium rosae]MBN7809267.1 AAA family ATPase [Agrobacterium rosae]
MTYSGFQIRHLSFRGNDRKPAIVSFQSGLNVVYGASDTGKSYIVEAIDFMLGGKGPLPDIPEAKGYDSVLLAIAFDDRSETTLLRSMAGGQFQAFEGLHTSIPDIAGSPLGEIHNERDESNLSSFLLSKIGLAGKRIRKNARDDTQALSFRNLARLAIVNEEEIIQKRSPLSDGNYTANTANTSVFTMLLTGVDDTALLSRQGTSSEEQKRLAQIDLLDQLIAEAQKRITSISGSRDELSDQEERLTKAMDNRAEQLAFTEEQFKKISTKRRIIIQRLETTNERYTEIATLLERFNLLQQHYGSDYERLIGIREAGSFFSVLDQEICPTCGASPDHHDSSAVCHGDVEVTILAAEAEMQKIEARQSELIATMTALKTEAQSIAKSLPNMKNSLRELSIEIETVVSPDLRKQRATYKELADKGANVRQALGLFSNVSDLTSRKAALERQNVGGSNDAASSARLTSTVVSPFAELAESVLRQWGFPGVDRVHFDTNAKDLIISGKPRTSYGKGLRAITQSAFTISLLQYCADNDLAHPGVVVLDSPLLSYREPDGADDDLSDTNLNGNFYRYLLSLEDDRQAIIVENMDPPSDVELGDRVIHFSGMVDEGRFGLFPR